VVTTTTTGIGCGSGIQLGQGILAVVDGGNQVLHQRIDRSGHGGLRGRNVFEHIRAQGHILVLAQDQRWLPVGLQHHGAAEAVTTSASAGMRIPWRNGVRLPSASRTQAWPVSCVTSTGVLAIYHFQ
jgi:hypothetical protein